MKGEAIGGGGEDDSGGDVSDGGDAGLSGGGDVRLGRLRVIIAVLMRRSKRRRCEEERVEEGYGGFGQKKERTFYLFFQTRFYI